MARVYTKIGDVFCVNLAENSKKYFQIIAYDLTQLNSDVIRVFRSVYSAHDRPELSNLINGGVEFYAHCVVKLGVKLGCWEKVGSIDNIGDTTDILFRDTNDYGSKPGEQIKISNNWYVWKINDKDFTRVGELKDNDREAEIGIVINPESIVHRIQTGEYDFVYPSYL